MYLVLTRQLTTKYHSFATCYTVTVVNMAVTLNDRILCIMCQITRVISNSNINKSIAVFFATLCEKVLVFLMVFALVSADSNVTKVNESLTVHEKWIRLV